MEYRSGPPTIAPTRRTLATNSPMTRQSCFIDLFLYRSIQLSLRTRSAASLTLSAEDMPLSALF